MRHGAEQRKKISLRDLFINERARWQEGGALADCSSSARSHKTFVAPAAYSRSWGESLHSSAPSRSCLPLARPHSLFSTTLFLYLLSTFLWISHTCENKFFYKDEKVMEIAKILSINYFLLDCQINIERSDCRLQCFFLVNNYACLI